MSRIEPDNTEALALRERFETGGASGGGKVKGKKRENKFQPQWGTAEARNPSAMTDKSPEDLYEYGATLFARKNYEHCADVFELSCKRSGNTLGPSCSNAVYCRMMIMDYGFVSPPLIKQLSLIFLHCFLYTPFLFTHSKLLPS